MEQNEYELMHAVEDRMWWYRGLRALVATELRRALARSPAKGPVLDAGCGTGGMLRVLGAGVAGRPTLGLEFNARAASMAPALACRISTFSPSGSSSQFGPAGSALAPHAAARASTPS